MIDDELAAAVEKIDESDGHPRQLAACGGKLVAQAEAFLFTAQEIEAGGEPLFFGGDAGGGGGRCFHDACGSCCTIT